jgi:hypothetical protein
VHLFPLLMAGLLPWYPIDSLATFLLVSLFFQTYFSLPSSLLFFPLVLGIEPGASDLLGKRYIT